MSQKSSKNLSTLSKHMTNDTKLQLDQNTITNRLIIPCLSTANTNPINGELYYDIVFHHFNIYYKTINFRSSWEANFAKWCDGSGIKWEYEPKAFNLGNTTYRPDFYLPEFDCWIEIKGYWRKDAREKVNKFISLNPSINFKLFEKQELQEIGVI